MKLKNVIFTAIAMILILVLSGFVNIVNAKQETSEMYLGITDLRTNSEPNMGYSIGNPIVGGENGAAKIWNIVQYNSESGGEYSETNFYCVRAGHGFSSTKKRQTYNIFYDMQTERETIASEVPVLSSFVNGKMDIGSGQTISTYDAVLAMFDMIYIPGVSTESDKEQLLNSAYEQAGISNENPNYAKYPLTIDDIEAVQQAAMWYFTNYDEAPKYDKTGNESWLYYTLTGDSYEELTRYNPDSNLPSIDAGSIREEKARALYNYLINSAKANANNYSEEGTKKAPAKVTTKDLTANQSGSNYVLGPIRVDEEQGNTISFDVNLEIKNNNSNVDNYKILNSKMEEVAEGTTPRDLVGQDFYVQIPADGVASISDLSITVNISYSNTKVTLWAYTKDDNEQPVALPEKEEINVPTVLKPNGNFDLALRKYITKINDVAVDTRVPNIDESTLQTGTTATYKHRKDPLVVKTGDKVTYQITIYNEGDKRGAASKVIDQLPEGLKFSRVVSGDYELLSYEEETNIVTLQVPESASQTIIEDSDIILDPYTQGNLDSTTIEIECEVTALPDESNSKILTNVAWISEAFNADDNKFITNEVGEDRDSEPATHPDVNKDNMEAYIGNGNKSDLTDSNYYYKGQQDDDDFEKLVMLPEAFDLKLIKRITAVNDQNVPERIEDVDVSKLNTIGEDGQMITTGEYTLSKDPVQVKKGDIVTYTFRIYNEGMINGYAEEITEDIPEGLEFIWSELEGEDLANDTTLSEEEKEAIEFNQNYLWGNFQYDETGEKIVQISTDYLSKENETTVGGNLIPAFGTNDGTKTEEDISYKEVSVKLKVVAENISGTIIRNEAAITEDANENGEPVDDRDSSTEDWVKYEDDEDYDNIILQSFDLSLRKFIIAVSSDEQVEDSEYLVAKDGSYTRAPVVDTSLLNTTDENGNLITTAIYKHTKEPVIVQPNSYVIYMLRVYNEGDIAGYAAEIKDHLPPYLEYVDSEFNKEYGWKVSEDGRTVTTRYLEDSLITEPKENEDGKLVLSYKEVPIMCKVNENAIPDENITNIADITEYQDEDKEPAIDRDSSEDNVNLPKDEDLPGYKGNETGEYIPGQEDDDDFEKVVVKIFDLSLRKWVTQAIVTDENGNTTVTETGHQPYDDPEDIVKVEIHRNKLNKTTVKFRYSIRVTNEGSIAGYATEITDYVPEGLKFVAEDNPGWTDEGNNVISTRLLENTLLQPGEYAEVEVVLTWINGEDTMGVMTNTAEISEDYNDYDVPDIDSTPDNKEPGEDDIDDAPVMLSISTGQARIYFTLGFTVLFTIAGGIILIKKFVL